jgi:ribosomal protein S18 acetylase RimI-like enzyme
MASLGGIDAYMEQGEEVPMILKTRESTVFEDIFELHNECFDEFERAPRGVLRTQYDTGQVFVMYGDPDYLLRRTLLGFLIRTSKHGEPHVWAVAVRKQSRGQGIGKALIDEAVCEVRENGLRWSKGIGLTVNVDNVPAIRLYLKEGFRVTKVLSGYYGPGGDGLLMRRKLV